jgi:hypothetical protein
MTFKFGDRFIPVWCLKFFQILMLIPLGYTTLALWRGLSFSGQAVQIELRKLFEIFGAALAGYLTLILAAHFGYLAKISGQSIVNHKYIFFRLDNLVICIAFLVTFLVFLGLKYIFRADKGVYPNSGIILYTSVAFLVNMVVIFSQSSLAAFMLLLPVAICWPLILPSKFFSKQLSNLFLVVLPLFYFLFALGYMISLTPAEPWGRYYLQAIAFMKWTPTAVCFAIAWLAIFIRMSIIAIHPPENCQTKLQIGLRRSKNRF